MNYKQLKTDDPGGTVEDAVTALQAMTASMPRDEHRITERTVYAVLGGTDGEKVLAALESAAQDNPVIARVLKWLNPVSGAGVDICNLETQAVLNTLVAGDVTQDMISSLIALKDDIQLKYPGVEASDVIFARAM